MSEPKKARGGASRRLGSLAGDGDASGSGLGSLRISPATAGAVKLEPGTGDAARKAGPGAAAPRRAKFMPTVPAVRRKKADASGADGAGVSVRAADFQHLIQQAQDEAANKGRGRGRGRGRGAGRGAAQAFFQSQQQVTLGGHMSAGGGLSKVSKPGAGGGASLADSKATKMKRMDTEEDFARLPDSKGDDGGEGGTLDYDQYYPTQLPLRPPEEEERAMLSLQPPGEEAPVVEGPGDVAAALGLTGVSDHERLLLFQLPQLLPAPPSARAASVKLEGGRGQRSRDDGAEAPPADQALSLEQLPAGRVGKLLVFESGAVKLQMGEVLLDVSLGSVCGFRQDVAATSTAGAGPGHFLQLGKLEARLVASPDIGQLLNDEPVPDWERVTSPASGGPSRPSTGDSAGIGDLEDDMSIDLPGPKKVKAEFGLAGASNARRQMVVSDDEDG